MKLLTGLFTSSLGKKYIMAATGVGLFLFTVAHMIGNLQIFMGRDQINAYGAFLQGSPELLWTARLGLLALVVLHIWSAIKLSAENRAARPVAYGNTKIVAASYASRTMLMSGLIVAAFIIYHLLHFTVQVPVANLGDKDFHEFVEVLADGTERHDVYRMMIVGFSNLWVSGFYLLGVGLLCLHLSHGVASMFQSLGLRNRSFAPRLAVISAWVLFLGYSVIPLAVLLGLGKEWR